MSESWKSPSCRHVYTNLLLTNFLCFSESKKINLIDSHSFMRSVFFLFHEKQLDWNFIWRWNSIHISHCWGDREKMLDLLLSAIAIHILVECAEKQRAIIGSAAGKHDDDSLLFRHSKAGGFQVEPWSVHSTTRLLACCEHICSLPDICICQPLPLLASRCACVEFAWTKFMFGSCCGLWCAELSDFIFWANTQYFPFTYFQSIHSMLLLARNAPKRCNKS